MITTIPLLLLAAALLLAIGVVSIMTILYVAKKCNRKRLGKTSKPDSLESDVDAWDESGKRL